MYHMIQKCSYTRILEIFFQEPTTLHFIREIGKRIKLAPTSVRNNIKDMLKTGLILNKKARPFDGFVANRDNDLFLFYKRVYNLYSLYELKQYIARRLYPKNIILFGSYSRGEDIESSDIDILIISNTKKELDVSGFEKKLKRKINIMTVSDLSKLDKAMQEKIKEGAVL